MTSKAFWYWRVLAIISFICSVAVTSLAAAQTPVTVQGGETLSIGGVNNILIRKPDAKASLILLTGGDGKLDVGPDAKFSSGSDNVLIRNRDAFADKGFNVLLVESGTSLTAAVKAMAKIKRPVTVVGTSAGTQRAAQGLVEGAKPDRLVLTSGFLSRGSGPSTNMMTIVPYAELLPPTLVIHHRDDTCRFTKAGGVDPFLAWAGGRARVMWFSGGITENNPCNSRAHHGFNGQDAELVSKIADFAGKL